MTAKQLNQYLVKEFPELEEKYHDETDWQEGDDTGSHVVYGDVFAPYIEKNIEKNDEEILKKIFDFIEEILSQNDKYSTEVIMFSILERLISNKEQFKICEKHLNKYTELAIKELI